MVKTNKTITEGGETECTGIPAKPFLNSSVSVSERHVSQIAFADVRPGLCCCHIQTLDNASCLSERN